MKIMKKIKILFYLYFLQTTSKETFSCDKKDIFGNVG
jgi:hypothetical protein